LGRDGSLVHDYDGNFSLSAVRALQMCSRAGVEVVIYSGRRKVTVGANARMLGQSAYIYEAGCGLVVDGAEEYLTGELLPLPEETVHDQITRSGAPELLLGSYTDRLEYHTPWHEERDFTHIFRGSLDIEEANTLLHEHGHAELRLLDNGTLHRVSPTLKVQSARVYHLLPRVASKARAAARHMQVRGYSPSECIAIGDSREDLGAAEVVGRFWLVANAIDRDPGLSKDISAFSNVSITTEKSGDGVLEAVTRMLVA
jgi:hydroxymethylpyrimidine pyrophosphatase-like HAD family hydrolase